MNLFRLIFNQSKSRIKKDAEKFLMDLPIPQNHHQFYPKEQIEQMTAYGLTINGSDGGLVLGPLHENNGVPIFQACEGGYNYLGEMEGYEYLWGKKATSRHLNLFHDINRPFDDMKPEFVPYKVPSGISVIDAFSPYSFPFTFKAKFILLDETDKGYCIFNKFSTEKKLHLLEKMNNSQEVEV